jgi:hypothetical protein
MELVLRIYTIKHGEMADWNRLPVRAIDLE